MRFQEVRGDVERLADGSDFGKWTIGGSQNRNYKILNWTGIPRVGSSNLRSCNFGFEIPQSSIFQKSFLDLIGSKTLYRPPGEPALYADRLGRLTVASLRRLHKHTDAAEA